MTFAELAWLSVIFLIVTGGSFLVLFRSAVQRRRAEERLREKQSDPAISLGSNADLLLGDLTPGMAAQVPMTTQGKAELQKELLAAGYYRRTALMEYAALRAVLVVAPLVGAGVLALLVDRSQIKWVLIGGVVAAVLGFSIPRLYLYFRGRVRARKIERGLPFAVDMLTLCLSAGQNLQAALQRVSKELRFAHPVLADELDIVHQQTELRSLQPALQQFADRVQVAEVRNLAMILNQSERLGADASTTLLEYSSSLRTTLRQRADAQANRTMFWTLFPTLLCLWIPATIILFGPAILEMRDEFPNATKELQNAKNAMKEANALLNKPEGAQKANQGGSGP
jgi:tight adherence protein C